MLEFKPFNLEDKDFICKYLRSENSRSADYNFGNNFMWADRYNQRYAAKGDRLIISVDYKGRQMFSFPIGSGAIEPAIEEIRALSGTRRMVIRGVTDEHKALLEDAYPYLFDFEPDRDSYDYIYTVEKMSTFSGKKLHAKRNHCNRFERENEWDFQLLTKELVPECMAMLKEWTAERGGEDDDGIKDEHSAILRGMLNYEKLGLLGGVLRSSGKVVGFTIGERSSADTFNVHFEKAYMGIHGAYPMVAREMARKVAELMPKVRYLNREEDMGLENLRKAKYDYFPEFLLAKYTATERKTEV